MNYPFKVKFKQEYQKWVQQELARNKTLGLTGAEANIATNKSQINGVLPGWVRKAWSEVDRERIKQGNEYFC